MIGSERMRRSGRPRRPLLRNSRCPFALRRLKRSLQSRLHYRQPHHCREVVVRGYPIVALKAASEATMDDGVLSLAAGECSDGRHRSAAVARAVARRFAIDMARIQALRAVVTMLPSIERRSYERPAVPATELVARSLKAALAPLISKCPRHGVLRLSRRPRQRRGNRGHVAIRLTMSRVRTRGVCMLQLQSCVNSTRNGRRIRSVAVDCPKRV